MSNKIKPMKWDCVYHNSDPKIIALSPLAELLYRRAMDLFWQSPGCRFPNVFIKLYNSIGRGFNQDQFSSCWLELQHDGFEAFQVSKDGQWIFSKKLVDDNRLLKKRADAGRKGGRVKKGTKTAKKLPEKNEYIKTIPARKTISETKTSLFEEIMRFNRE